MAVRHCIQRLIPPRRPRRPIPEGVTESERWLLQRIRQLDEAALIDILSALRQEGRHV